MSVSPCIFHDAIRGSNLGPLPAGQIQRLGSWEMPPNLYKNFRDAVQTRGGDWVDCVRDGVGAPTVACTIAVQLSQGNGSAQPTPTQQVNNGVQVDGQGVDWSAAKLRVIYGSGDTDFPEFDCDLINGDSFPLIARSCEFYLVYPIEFPPNGKEGIYVQPRLDLSVSIGIGTLGASGVRGARMTVKLGNVGSSPNTSALVPLPKMAVSAIYSDSNGGAAPTMQQWVSPAGAGILRAVNPLSKLEYQSIPITNGARGFNVVGGGETGNNDLEVIFFLSTA